MTHVLEVCHVFTEILRGPASMVFGFISKKHIERPELGIAK